MPCTLSSSIYDAVLNGSGAYAVPPSPPCQDDRGKVYQTLESLGSNILSAASQMLPELNSQEISSLNLSIQSDLTDEMNQIMAAGNGTTNPPFYQAGHYNLDISNPDIINDLGSVLGQQFITAFTVVVFGALDGVRRSAPDQRGYILHSELSRNGTYTFFHFDRFGYRNLAGHWAWDVAYGSLAHPCLDPAWRR